MSALERDSSVVLVMSTMSRSAAEPAGRKLPVFSGFGFHEVRASSTNVLCVCAISSSGILHSLRFQNHATLLVQALAVASTRFS